MLYFAVSGIDLLNSLDQLRPGRDEIIDWIYLMQIRPGETRKHLLVRSAWSVTCYFDRVVS